MRLEEGVTEVYSHDNLNRYIDDLGLEEVAPGIKDADAAVADKKYLPAAQNVADTIGRNSGLESARRSVDLKSLFGAADRRERHCRRTWRRRLGRG